MISNSSPLIIFGKLNNIEILLKICASIEISNSVFEEVVVRGSEIQAKDALIIKDFVDNNRITVKKLSKEFQKKAKKIEEIYTIDIGEAETIALALQLKQKEIIIDEIAAREAAKSIGLKPIGSLRVLLLAYKENLISKERIKKIIEEMVNSKYRFSPQVLIEFWKLFEKV